MTFWDIAMSNNEQLLQGQDHTGKPQNHKRKSDPIVQQQKENQ